LQRNAIDGVSSGPPVIEQMLQEGLAVVVADGTTGKIDPPSLAHIAANVLMTRRQLCTDHRSLCVKMGAAMVKANAFMHQHPKEAMAMLGKRLNAKGLSAADDMNVEAGFMKASEKLPSYDKIFTNEFVK